MQCRPLSSGRKRGETTKQPGRREWGKEFKWKNTETKYEGNYGRASSIPALGYFTSMSDRLQKMGSRSSTGSVLSDPLLDELRRLSQRLLTIRLSEGNWLKAGRRVGEWRGTSHTWYPPLPSPTIVPRPPGPSSLREVGADPLQAGHVPGDRPGETRARSAGEGPSAHKAAPVPRAVTLQPLQTGP